MTNDVLDLLEESRRREKEQTLIYRKLAADAESVNDGRLVERFNDLHADEQHHFSRLTARILELGGVLPPPPAFCSELVALKGWEEAARIREDEEVAWYRAALDQTLDPVTRKLLEEILESEEHQARDLAGKWMPA